MENKNLLTTVAEAKFAVFFSKHLHNVSMYASIYNILRKKKIKQLLIKPSNKKIQAKLTNATIIPYN